MILLAVFTGCGDGVARAYDAKSATLKRIFQGHEGAINCLVCVDDKLYTGIFKIHHLSMNHQEPLLRFNPI